ncbi:hypothetical protein [Actinokineospora cianjurensis]|uniref:Uncharacterized protein n=1 Tax=Actinokineospora cianjurensis TaxID=585224 RepID=A0A421BDD4_9PSEU|nr:hypothetical protein [Actinokineospora cianjurensis]RLK62320.1 hypothetical protein CLV68_2877 [Actinokineospora cianjurensis]
MTCADCAHDLSHCHGTLLLPDSTLPECTDPSCVDLAESRHPLTATAHDLLTQARTTPIAA